MSRNPRVLLAVAGILCLLFAASYLGRLWELNHAQAGLALRKQDVQLAQQQQARLSDELAYVQSEEYAMQVARDELGQSQPGDQVLLVLPEGAVASTAAPAANPDEPPRGASMDIASTESIELAATSDELTSQTANWQQWLSLFVDGL